MDSRSARAAALLSIAECLRFGTTSVSDMYFFDEAIAQAVSESSITLGDIVLKDVTESTVLQLIHKTNGATRDFTFADVQAVNPAWDETFFNQYLEMAGGLSAMPAMFVYKLAENTQSGEDGWYCSYDTFGFFKMNDFVVPAGMAFILSSGDNDAGIILPKENL